VTPDSWCNILSTNILKDIMCMTTRLLKISIQLW
jgi:hypothetical protein